MKGMVGLGKQFQCGARAELFDERLQQLRVGKLVPASLEEQHWNLHVEEMFAPLVRWSPGGMKREPKEGNAPDSRQWRCRLHLRRHAAAESHCAAFDRSLLRRLVRLLAVHHPRCAEAIDTHPKTHGPEGPLERHLHLPIL